MRFSRTDVNSKKVAVFPFLQSIMPEMLARLNRRARRIKFFNKVSDYESKINEFISSYRKVPLGSESFLVVLRRWNSYTPSLPVPPSRKGGLSQHSVGGGYYLHVQSPLKSLAPGYGLVIDPGYNFIHNFGAAGFCLDDIDGVLMTHAHNDHTNDFESLLSLLYKRNKGCSGLRQPKKIDLFMNVGAFKKFSNYLDLANKRSKDYLGKVVVMSPGQRYKIPERDDLNCDIFTLFTNHHEIITADYALGICIKASDRTIYFTGDTGWKFETSRVNEMFLKDPAQGVEKIDILVAHIGTVKPTEFNLTTLNKFDACFYDNHLGFLGCICMIEQWKPEVAIISEFGEELSNAREALVRQINHVCSKFPLKTICFAGDVGFFLLLDSMECLCYRTRTFVNFKRITCREVKTTRGQEIQYSVRARKKSGVPPIEQHDGLNVFREKHLKLNTQKAGSLSGSLPLNKLVARLIKIRDLFDVTEEVQDSDKLVALSYAITSVPGNVVSTLISAFGKTKRSKLIAKLLNNYGITAKKVPK